MKKKKKKNGKSHLSFFHTHEDFEIADPSSTQDACHT